MYAKIKYTELYVKKFTSFCQVLKHAHKRKLGPFSASRCIYAHIQGYFTILYSGRKYRKYSKQKLNKRTNKIQRKRRNESALSLYSTEYIRHSQPCADRIENNRTNIPIQI